MMDGAGLCVYLCGWFVGFALLVFWLAGWFVGLMDSWLVGWLAG